MATTVAVLGGGVGGLSAAHELVERGFAVTVYEKRGVAGGKARSYPTRPWVSYLESRGVRVRLGEPVEGFVVDGREIAGVRVGGRLVEADYYVAALPENRAPTRHLSGNAPHTRPVAHHAADPLPAQ